MDVLVGKGALYKSTVIKSSPKLVTYQFQLPLRYPSMYGTYANNAAIIMTQNALHCTRITHNSNCKERATGDNWGNVLYFSKRLRATFHK